MRPQQINQGLQQMRRGEQQRQTWHVSFTVYSSTPETWYKEIEFCLLGLSFHSSRRSGVWKHKSQLVSENSRGLVCLVEEGQFVFFYTLQKHILYSCCQWNNVFSTGSLVLVMVKKNKKKTQRVRNKKLVVPNATMRTPPHRHHLVEMQVFRQSGPLKQRPNGNLAESREGGWAFSERIALVKCFVGASFRERWLLEKNKTHTRTQQQFQVQISLFTRSRRVQLQGRTLGLEHQHP